MRILVVGGSGYVGSLIRPGLAAAGHEIRVLDPAAPAGGNDWVQGTATDPAALTAALDGADAVVHAAMARHRPGGILDIVRAHEVNVPVTDRVLTETSPPDAVDSYGLTKRLAESVGQAAADAHGMTITVLRVGWPTTDQAWPAWALPAFGAPTVLCRADGTPVPALAASDLTTAVLAALDRDTGGFDVFHIVGDDGSGRCLSTAKARDLLGWQPKRR